MSPSSSSPTPSTSAPSSETTSTEVLKRDGRVVPFEADRIREALAAAFRAAHDPETDQSLSDATRETIENLTCQVANRCQEQDRIDVETIQDEVERALMQAGEHRVARRYILYRENRAENRSQQDLHYETADGRQSPIPHDDLRRRIAEACRELDEVVGADTVYDRALSNIYDGIPKEELDQALILAARSMVEAEPDYTYVAARLLLQTIYEEATQTSVSLEEAETTYRESFADYVQTGINAGHLDPALGTFDMGRLAGALHPERDWAHTYLSIQTLYDRYLLKTKEGRRYELPQWMWMRVAMGLALNEEDRKAKTIEFYELLSTRRFIHSTPTLFNAGTVRPQLASCYLTTVQDDLEQIFEGYKDNALLSKWAGGLGNDWTNVRAMGAYIRGTGGESKGVVPFLKIANDTTVAVNQGGKRKGASCAYLETWHLDIEEFLELRRNTGDDRRRTHDMNTANWVPDLFMKRVQAGEEWTLFSPDEVPDLHHLYGKAFEERYRKYERQADAGEIENWERVDATMLWRKMLSMLFETGHPWITFKDPSNVRSPQDHVGVVHSSNLCTEITLNTSENEIAVCNLGSVNLPQHLGEDGTLDHEKLKATVTTAIRMLDNVIDLNFYPVEEAKNSNLRHRPIGLGIMGFQDAVYEKGISYASEDAVEFADQSTEAISYYAIRGSARLAEERGTYESFEGSKWDRGLLPIDTIDLLEKERGQDIEVDRSQSMDWNPIRSLVAEHGMRNSNVMAIAPTATISNIAGVSQSIEPSYKHLYAASNLSGDFTQVNTYLVEELKEEGLWDAEMVDDLKYYDGSLMEIERVPDALKKRYPTAFEIPPSWLIACAARRQKWIDQSQSLNLYVDQPDGKRISEMYQRAWRKGLKTTYYLRSQAATAVEKSTLDVNKRGIQPRWMESRSASSNIEVDRREEVGREGVDRGEGACSSPTSDLPSDNRDGEACEVCQ